MKKKQKGYVLILTMAMSVLALSFAATVSNDATVENEEIRIGSFTDDIAKQTIDFSTGISKLMLGVGALPGDELKVGDLKDLGLLNEGYTETIAFNQELTAYYVTNPDNENIIDVLVTVRGIPDASIMSKYGTSANSLKSFWLEVAEKGMNKGFAAASESEEFYVGSIDSNGRKLQSFDGETVDISHVNVDLNTNGKETFGIYLKAPNQSGWWRMRIGPSVWHPRPYMRSINRPQDVTEMIYNGVVNTQVQNDGFSYFCPADAYKVDFGEEVEIEKLDYNSRVYEDRSIFLCLRSYKGTVQEDISDHQSIQMFNPVGEDDPYPVSNVPGWWGRCFMRALSYTETSSYRSIRCYNSSDFENLVLPNSIIGINNDAMVDSYAHAIRNSAFLENYDMDRKDQDFKVPNVIAANGMIRRIDDRYIKTYTVNGTFITGGQDEEKYDRWNNAFHFNTVKGYGLKISNQRPVNEYEITEHEYTDGDGNKRSLSIKIPTPFIESSE